MTREWPTWPISQLTRDPHDPWPSPRPWHESITTYESWWVHDYCLLFSAISNSGYGVCSTYTVSLVVYTAIVTNWTRWTVILFVTFLWMWTIHYILHVYTSRNHGSSVLRYWSATHVTHSHFVDPFDPWSMTCCSTVCSDTVAQNILVLHSSL